MAPEPVRLTYSGQVCQVSVSLAVCFWDCFIKKKKKFYNLFVLVSVNAETEVTVAGQYSENAMP